MKDKDIGSLEHTMWRCQYQVICGEIKQDIGRILRQLCQQKGVEIIEAELCRDHVHMLISIPPKYSVSQIMGYLKGKSSPGYYVDTVGRNKKQIQEYIRNQLQEDQTEDQSERICGPVYGSREQEGVRRAP